MIYSTEGGQEDNQPITSCWVGKWQLAHTISAHADGGPRSPCLHTCEHTSPISISPNPRRFRIYFVRIWQKVFKRDHLLNLSLTLFQIFNSDEKLKLWRDHYNGLANIMAPINHVFPTFLIEGIVLWFWNNDIHDKRSGGPFLPSMIRAHIKHILLNQTPTPLVCKMLAYLQNE